MTAPIVPAAFAVVVSHDANRLELLDGLVRRAGLKAVPFTGAEAALAALQSGPTPALIVTELNMPGVDGWRFCRLLRSSAGLACHQIPIIVVTAFLASDRLRYIAAGAGADAFLSLPQDAEEFVAQAQALRQGQPKSTQSAFLILSADAEYTALLAQTCRAQGYQAGTATTVQEALESCAGADYQWAVLDEELLDGPGAVLLEQIHRRLPDCLCLILAADPTPEQALRWMKQGAWAWLRKPCAPEQVLELCANARRERSALHAERLWEAHSGDLNEERRRLEFIIEGTHAGTWEWNVQTGETIFNERWVEIVGYTLAELSPVSIKTWEKLAHPEDFQRSGELLARHFAGELPYYECECRMRHKDGRWVWVRDHGKVISRTADGQPWWVYGTHIDITELKESAEVVRESEERYRRITERITDYVYTVRIESGVAVETRHGPGCLAVTGYRERDFVRNPLLWLGMVPEADRARVVEQARRATAGEAAAALEHRIVRKDGQTRWVSNTPVLKRDAGGVLTGYDGLITDITERKLAEDTLHQRGEDLARLLEVSRTLAGTLDLQTVLQAAVDGASRLLGLGSAAIYLREGERLDLLAASPPLPPDLPEYFRHSALADHPRVQQVLATGRPVLQPDITKVELGQEERAITEARQLRTLLFLPLVAGEQTLGTLIAGSVKEPRPVAEAQIDLGLTLANLAALAVVNARLYEAVQGHVAELEREVAERKRAEAEVRESEQRFRTLADSGQVLIWTSGTDKKCDYFNQPWLTFTGRTLDQELGDGWAEGVHPDDLRRCLETYTRAFDGRARFSMDYRLRRHDGEFRWIQDIGVPRYDSQGNFLGYIGHCLDITERKEAQQALEDTLLFLTQNENIARIGGFRTNPRTDFLLWTEGIYRLIEAPLDCRPGLAEGLQFYAPEYRPLIRDAVTRTLETGAPFVLEAELVTTSGKRLWAEVRGLARVEAGGEAAVVGTLQDITERKVAEQRLQESERKLSSILRAAPVGIGVVINRILKAVNERTCAMTGYAREELLEQSARLLYPSDEEFDYVGREKYRQLKESGTGTVETRWRRKDGTLIHVVLSSTAINSKDLSQGVVFSALDITDRKRAEQALRESRDQFQSLINNLPGTAFRCRYDADWTMLYISTSVDAITGYRAEELINNTAVSYGKLNHPEDNARAADEVSAAIAENRAWAVEYRVLHRDGNYRWVFEKGRAVRDERGEVLYLDGFITDITDRKRAEQALRESEEKYRELVQSANSIILRLDTEGRVAFINEYAQRLFGFTEEEILGRSVVGTIVPERESSGRDLRALIRDLCARPDDFAFNENENVTRGGDRIWIAWTNRRLRDDTGNLAGLLCVGTDITARKRAEEALKASEMRFEGILRNVTTVAVQGYAMDGTVRYWNAASETLYGYAAEEALGRNLLDLIIPPVMREDVRAAIRQMAETSEAIPAAELQLMRKDGSLVPVFSSHVIVRVPGQAAELFCIDVDLSDRRRAEAALRESEERLREIGDNLPGGMIYQIIMPKDGRRYFTYLSHQVESLHGYSAEEVRADAMLLYRQVHPDDIERMMREEQKAIEKLTIFDVEACFIIRSGEVRWRRIISNPRLLGNQDIIADGIEMDITDRRRAEEALRESEDRFATAFRASPAMLVLSEIDTGRFIDVNDRWLQVLGHTREETIGQTSYALGIWEDPEARKKMGEIIRRDGSFREVSVRFITKPGERRDVLWSAETITLGGKRIMLSLLYDITERKMAEAEKDKLQAQLLQSQKMESVGRLAGGVAHDFNNMLQAILGNTALALEDLPPDHPLRENLQEIQTCAQRSADLTRQLLAFARKQTIAPKELNLNETVGGMLKMLRRLIGEDLDLVWAPAAGLGLVNMDPTQVDQILANLCVNARDAMGSRVGKVTIETADVAFDEAYVAEHPEARAGRFVRLAVSDNGCGMSQEVKDHLFEPFFTTKGMGQGTGLGLATVYGIVKQNHGFINVYSEPGQGTTVQIHLPLHAVPLVKPAGPSAALALARGHETILLVEDEPAILRVSQRALAKLGYRVLAARTPGEAMQLAREHEGEIHLLMTDVVMPEMNGRDLARNLLSQYPNLKRLFMSGYTANVIAHHGVLDPGVHFLQKPFTVQALAAKVREALDE